MKSIYLVACVAQKTKKPGPAEDLYISDWFTKARSYVTCQMGTQDRWYILSAKYHLVEPGKTISPYNETLNEMRKPDRLRWAECVLSQLLPSVDVGDTIILLAGSRYRDGLESALRDKGCTVEVPMAGLGIGRQKAWLLSHTGARAVQM